MVAAQSGRVSLLPPPRGRFSCPAGAASETAAAPRAPARPRDTLSTATDAESRSGDRMRPRRFEAAFGICEAFYACPGQPGGSAQRPLRPCKAARGFAGLKGKPGQGPAGQVSGVAGSHLPTCHIPSPALCLAATACGLALPPPGTKTSAQQNTTNIPKHEWHLPAPLIIFCLFVSNSQGLRIPLPPAGQAPTGCCGLPTSAPGERNCPKDPSPAAVHPGTKCCQAVKKLATKK